jgi:hypothetical protein
MNLPADARPTTFTRANLVPGGSAVVVWDTELYGVITSFTGGIITSVGGTFAITIDGILVMAGQAGGSAESYLLATFSDLWVLIQPASIINVGFDSIDGAASMGFSLDGWQYNREG